MQLASFGRRLKELREAAGLTQDQLAEKAGLGKNVIGRLERGAREPGWLTILSLAASLNVTCEAFNQPPAAVEQPKRGRPRKAKDEDAG